MGRRRPQSDSGGGGSWMDTYGDLVTLLLTFFVLLYSFSSIDAAKWESLVKSLQRSGRPAAGSTGTPSGGAIGTGDPLPDDVDVEAIDLEADIDGAPVEPAPAGTIAPTVAATVPPTAAPTPRPTAKPAATTARPASGATLSLLYKDIQGYLSSTPLSGSATLEQKGSQILIRMRVSLIFEPGSDKLKPEAQQILNEVATLVRRHLPVVKSLRTEGHTDSITPPAGEIESKWELAAMRAAKVLQQLVTRTGIDPGKVYTVGFGSARPIASNSTAEGRSLNNRVDVIIVN